MSRQNKKESVAALHKENILSSAEKLFLAKGVASTTIDDISKSSAYCKRTIYAYFESKDDILHHIILKGLAGLKVDLLDILQQQRDFISQYHMICEAMEKYQVNSPQSAYSVNQMSSNGMNSGTISPTVTNIIEFGAEINNLLAGFIEQGKRQGAVRTDIEPMQTVYIMWSCITSLVSLVQNKGEFFEKQFSTSRESFLEYGYKQILNSLLENRI